MEYISSDTNVWIDFEIIGHLDYPFKLNYKFLMNVDAISDELLSPPNLGKRLISYGLIGTELTEEEFYLADEYIRMYPKLSKYDCIALAIAKNRNIVLMTGDHLLRKVAIYEGVELIGTIGVLDQLFDEKLITKSDYLDCLNSLRNNNGKKVRLPAKEIEERIDKQKIKV